MSLGPLLSKLVGRSVGRACYTSVGRACYSTVGRQVGVWGACTDGGQPHLGTGEAPGLIRAAGLVGGRMELGMPFLQGNSYLFDIFQNWSRHPASLLPSYLHAVSY